MSTIKKGTVFNVPYEGTNLKAVVIDPDGLGKAQPTIGLGFRGMEGYTGLPQSTLSNWLTKESGFEGDPNNDQKSLKPPSGRAFGVTQILADDGNYYLLIEAADWVALVIDVLKTPGKIKKSTKSKLLDFLGWFAVKGFYADAYAVLKGSYTVKDSRTLSDWAQSRLMGTRKRNKYTDFLQNCGCRDWDYARWTNYIYMGLFGMKKSEIVRIWNLVEGSKTIGRNYIPEAIGLEAVAYCESMTVDLFIDDLHQAHDDAINYTRRKFFGGFLANFE